MMQHIAVDFLIIGSGRYQMGANDFAGQKNVDRKYNFSSPPNRTMVLTRW